MDVGTKAFVRERAGMTLGWTGSFDALETLLDPVSAVRIRRSTPA